MAVGEQARNTNNAQPAVRAAQRPSRGSNSGAGQDWEKADAFINIAIPTANGNRTRVDSIKLKLSNVVHAQIIAKLSDPNLTPEEKAAKLESFKANLVLEFTLPLSDEEKTLADF